MKNLLVLAKWIINKEFRRIDAIENEYGYDSSRYENDKAKDRQ